jgi:glycosyltransferase involved in cell wall biosynthesis
VSDLWPSAGLELGALKENFSYKILKKLERFNYKNADLILGQSNEILNHIKNITTKPDLFLYRNFPDIKPPQLIDRQKPHDRKLTLVYAGLLGVAQGILKLCTQLDYQNVELHIYGSGAEEHQIKDFIKKNNKLPIFFYGRAKRDELHQKLLDYDITLIPLLNRIYGSVPSKIFEFSKLGLPIIYFGGGEGETIIEQNKLGWIAKEGDYIDLNKIIQQIKPEKLSYNLRSSIQKTAMTEFNFNTQLELLKGIL